jgi:hypothetical protein
MFMMPEMKVYLASAATDMRKSYDGLARLIKDDMGQGENALLGSQWLLPVEQKA